MNLVDKRKTKRKKARKIQNFFRDIGCIGVIAVWCYSTYLLTKVYSYYDYNLYLKSIWNLVKYMFLFIVVFIVVFMVIRQIFPSVISYSDKEYEKHVVANAKEFNRKLKWSLRSVISDNPSIVYLFLFIILIIVFYFIDAKYFVDSNPYKDILVEAHGLIFDALIFGVLIGIYEKIRSKHDYIVRYKDKIEECRGWREVEASRKISAGIRKLSIYKVDELRIVDSFVTESKMIGVYLCRSLIFKSDFEKSNLCKANLEDSYVVSSSFKEIELKDAIFIDSVILNNDFSNSDLRRTDFSNSYILRNKFDNANFDNAILSDAYVDSEKWFEELKLSGVIGVDNLENKYDIIEEHGEFMLSGVFNHASYRYGSDLDEDIETNLFKENMTDAFLLKRVFKLKLKR